MSPTPLIELQRRLAIAGAIRMGEKTDKGAPKRLTTFRITSPDESLVVQAAGLYGGKPEPWESPNGSQFEVVTTASELPVLVMPGYSFNQTYELRTSPTLVERRCDGLEMDDGQACKCNAEGDDKCDLITRLVVALPELTTMLGWRLQTKGDNAAKELLASMDLVRGVAGGRPFVPAKLRIVERRGSVNGQAVRYVVPVIDVSIRYAEVLAGELGEERTALPGGYKAIEAPRANGSSLAEGLVAAETQGLTRTSRSAAPIAVVEDVEIVGAPEPPEESGASMPSPSESLTPSSDSPDAPANIETVSKLVGSLRRRKLISTENVWAAVANLRKVDVDVMIDLLKGRDADGKLHWPPLRNDLQEAEIVNLQERLMKLHLNASSEVVNA